MTKSIRQVLHKFPLADLDTIIKDPARYNPRKSGGSYTRQLALRNAIFLWHKSKDLKVTEQYLNRAFNKHGWDDFLNYKFQLEEYTESYIKLNCNFTKSQMNFIFKVPGANSDINVNGQIARIDIKKPNIRWLWIFGREQAGWQTQYRYPVLQSAYAEDRGIPLEDVAVGVYDFASGEHEIYSFNQKEVDFANETALEALEILIQRK
ncbi:MAG: hypothetical protein C0473_01695 [Cyanobacteria bacterium DS3.002]|nr:hypothetical protein [Cyanobacteria bacterium DS3.002]MBA4049543.1 hypothetical protein [Cyanobacteria bacterium DS2.008]MBA4078775.1 hypothetical protein [Cyanobacteria bacterium PR.023]